MNILEILNKNTIKDCGDLLVAVCHNASVHAGWWHDLTTGALKPVTQELVGDKLMLCVTELAEAKEGEHFGDKRVRRGRGKRQPGCPRPRRDRQGEVGGGSGEGG